MSKDLKVLAECVDARTGKRFLPGETFDPVPTADQARRLVAARCLPEGAIALGEKADAVAEKKADADARATAKAKDEAAAKSAKAAADAEAERIADAEKAEQAAREKATADAKAADDAVIKADAAVQKAESDEARATAVKALDEAKATAKTANELLAGLTK